VLTQSELEVNLVKQLILAEFENGLSDKCIIKSKSFMTRNAFHFFASLLNKEKIEAKVIGTSTFLDHGDNCISLIIDKSSLRACKSVDPFIQELRIAAGIPTLPSSSRTLNQIPVSNNNNILPQTSLPELDEKWQELLINLIGCVKRTHDGKVIGIDSNKRRKVIQNILEGTPNASRFPNYIKKNNAGNIVITTNYATTSTTIKESEKQHLLNYPNNIARLIGNMHLVQNVRYDLNNKLVGRTLYGGLAAKNDSCIHAAIKNSAEKISKSVIGNNPVEVINNQNQTIQRFKTYTESKIQPLATSIHDVSYLINSFLPRRQFLNSIRDAGKIDEATFLFFQQILDNDQNGLLGFLLHEPASLKLAVSNTYQLNLNENETHEIFENVTDKTASEIGKLKYQIEFRPLLSCLYPQDYLYAHEFYCGLLPRIKQQVNHNREFFKEILKIATTNIISRILDNIAEGHLPKEIYGLNEYEAADVWKDLVEINIVKFMRWYPGFQWDTVQEVFGLDYNFVVGLSQDLQAIWTNERDNIAAFIASVIQSDNVPVDYRSDLIVGLPADLTAYTSSSQTSTNTQTNNVLYEDMDAQETANRQQRLEQAKIEAINNLIESSMTLETFVSPILAVDGFIYDKEFYEKLGTKPSPMTRENLENKPIFEFNLLDELITAHTENDKPKQTQALFKLCKDMFTDALMRDPVIVIFESNDNHSYIPKIMDRTTFNQLPPKYKVHTHRDFSELREVIRLMDNELKSTIPLPDWNRLDSNYPMPTVQSVKPENTAPARQYISPNQSSNSQTSTWSMGLRR
jgi:hypothetical protein